ncbi:hypothetical protein BJV82DRAFT_631972 [Fennellomyces sp. T-0311]|nr:hypothetical protein BJV82DRAFT_631972 [Fennellomyces sp. T-0311]
MDTHWCSYCDNAVSPYSDSLYCSDECLRQDALQHHPMLGYNFSEYRGFLTTNAVERRTSWDDDSSNSSSQYSQQHHHHIAPSLSSSVSSNASSTYKSHHHDERPSSPSKKTTNTMPRINLLDFSL